MDRELPVTRTSRFARFAYYCTAVALFLVMFKLAVTSMAAQSPTFDEQGFIVRGLGYARGVNHHMQVGHPLGLNLLNATLLVGDDEVRLPTDHPSWAETSFHRPAELFLWEIGNNVEHIMFLARLPTVWLALLLAAVAARWAGEIVGSGEWGVGSGRLEIGDWRLGEATSTSLEIGRLGGRLAGLLALALLAFDPNILAHAGLATTDLGLTAGATLAGYTLWRFLRWPGLATAALAGVGMGLLQNTKFTALLFVPLFGFVLGAWVWRRRVESGEWRLGDWEIGRVETRDWRLEIRGKGHEGKGRSVIRHLQSTMAWVVVYGLVALVTLWATNGFQIGQLPEALPLLSPLGGMTIPLAHYLEQLVDIGGRLQVSTPSFLAGQYSDQGWWYYFPVAFLLKTPLPTLILLLLAMVLAIRGRLFQRGRHWVDAMALLVPAIGYFAIALTSEINLGYRHLLPVLPFLYVGAAAVLGRALAGERSLPTKVGSTNRLAGGWLVGVIGICLLALGATSFWVAPHYLAFFNRLAGGPERGWHWLVDSNIDWGQDLGRLKTWMEEHEVEHVWLSYFGEGRPEYYGISYTGLDSFPPRLMNPQARPFYPYDPAPGVYALSVTNLQGVHFANHEQFAWFREREPLDHVGHSILIYEVPARGHPTALLLSGIQIDELAAADFASLETNAVIPRWFDAAQSWLIPATDPVWLARGAQQEVHPIFANGVQLEWVADGEAEGDNGYVLYQPGELTGAVQTWTQPPSSPPLAVFLGQEGRKISLLGYTILNNEIENGDSGELLLMTVWRQEGNPAPVRVFVHWLQPDGVIAGQFDGLGVAWEGWRSGDILLQLHPLPADLPPGEYRLVAGLYDPLTLIRWTASDQDMMTLGRMVLPDLSKAE